MPELNIENIFSAATLLFAACAMVAALTLRLRQSVIVGYLLAGVIIGPHGFAWLGESQVELVGEIGVVFLLFFLGTELSLARLRPLVRSALLGGSLQIALTVGVALLVGSLNGWSWLRGAYFGCIVALSSTAIVVKLLTAKDELRTPHGKLALAVLLFQDLAVVPMMIILPVMASPAGGAAEELLLAAGKALAFLALSYVVGRWVFPPLLKIVARSRSQELFTLTVLAVALGMAVVSNRFGLSLAMGAFVAGLILGQSPFSYKILADVMPFRDAFLSLFFVSIGMVLHPALSDLPTIAGLVILIITLKVIVCTVVGRSLGLPLGIALQGGFALCQVGEFSLLLAKTGYRHGDLDPGFYQLIISSSVITMALSPWLLKVGAVVSDWTSRIPSLRRHFVVEGDSAAEDLSRGLADHVVICGFGPVGRLVAAALAERGITFIVLELNPDTVAHVRSEGIPVVYGDARSELILEKVSIERARALVVALPHVETAEGVVRNVRLRFPLLPIYARAIFSPHQKILSAAGASVTVHDEHEAGLAIARVLLEELREPQNDLEDLPEDRERENETESVPV